MRFAARIVLGLGLLPAAFSAAPLLWSVSGSFADGGTVSGSFLFDPATNAFSSINVVTTAGSVLGGSDTPCRTRVARASRLFSCS